MSAEPQVSASPPSRWRLFLDRWNTGADRGEPLWQRFRAAFDAFSLASHRRVNPLLLLALTAALAGAVALLVYGAVWWYGQSRVSFVQLYVLLKFGKWIALGVALVAALALRNWVMKSRAAAGTGSAPQ